MWYIRIRYDCLVHIAVVFVISEGDPNYSGAHWSLVLDTIPNYSCLIDHNIPSKHTSTCRYCCYQICCADARTTCLCFRKCRRNRPDRYDSVKADEDDLDAVDFREIELVPSKVSSNISSTNGTNGSTANFSNHSMHKPSIPNGDGDSSIQPMLSIDPVNSPSSGSGKDDEFEEKMQYLTTFEVLYRQGISETTIPTVVASRSEPSLISLKRLHSTPLEEADISRAYESVFAMVCKHTFNIEMP